MKNTSKLFNEEFTFDFGNDSNEKKESIHKPVRSKKVEKESEEFDNNAEFDEDLIEQENDDDDKSKSKKDAEILNKQGLKFFLFFNLKFIRLNLLNPDAQ
jgi:hypothetical protein